MFRQPHPRVGVELWNRGGDPDFRQDDVTEEIVYLPRQRDDSCGIDVGDPDFRQDDVTEQIMYLVIVIGNESGGRLGSS